MSRSKKNGNKEQGGSNLKITIKSSLLFMRNSLPKKKSSDLPSNTLPKQQLRSVSGIVRKRKSNKIIDLKEQIVR